MLRALRSILLAMFLLSGCLPLPIAIQPYSSPITDGLALGEAEIRESSGINAEDAQAIVDEVLEGAGWVKLYTEGAGGGSATSYTLPTDLIFDTAIGERRYEDLYEGLRVAMHPITGEGRNPERGWVFEKKRNGKDWFGVHDHETGTNYLPPGARPLTARERAARMNENLRGGFALPRAATVGATRRRTQRSE